MDQLIGSVLVVTLVIGGVLLVFSCLNSQARSSNGDDLEESGTSMSTELDYSGAALDILHPRLSRIMPHLRDATQEDLDEALRKVDAERQWAKTVENESLRCELLSWCNYFEREARDVIPDQKETKKVLQEYDRERRQERENVRRTLEAVGSLPPR